MMGRTLLDCPASSVVDAFDFVYYSNASLLLSSWHAATPQKSLFVLLFRSYAVVLTWVL